MLTTIRDKVTENQKAVFERKLGKGTDLLNIDNGIGPYYNDTESFVKRLSEHLKIVTICGKDNLKDCLPYETIQQDGAEPFKVKDLETAAFTGIDKTKYLDAAGFVLADGTPMILTYMNKDNCPISDPDAVEYKGQKKEARSTNTRCIAGFYDLNGTKGPNKFNKDIVPFGVTGLAEVGIKLGDSGITLLSEPHVPTTVLKTGDICTNNNGTYKIKSDYKTKYNIENCCTVSDCISKGDYWASAMVECKDMGGHLATEKDLAKIATYLYDAPSQIGDTARYDGTLNTSKLGTTFAGLGSSWDILWSSSESSASIAYYRYFYSSFTGRYNDYRFISSYRAVCVK